MGKPKPIELRSYTGFSPQQKHQKAYRHSALDAESAGSWQDVK